MRSVLSWLATVPLGAFACTQTPSLVFDAGAADASISDTSVPEPVDGSVAEGGGSTPDGGGVSDGSSDVVPTDAPSESSFDAAPDGGPLTNQGGGPSLIQRS